MSNDEAMRLLDKLSDPNMLIIQDVKTKTEKHEDDTELAMEFTILDKNDNSVCYISMANSVGLVYVYISEESLLDIVVRVDEESVDSIERFSLGAGISGLLMNICDDCFEEVKNQNYSHFAVDARKIENLVFLGNCLREPDTLLPESVLSGFIGKAVSDIEVPSELIPEDDEEDSEEVEDDVTFVKKALEFDFSKFQAIDERIQKGTGPDDVSVAEVVFLDDQLKTVYVAVATKHGNIRFHMNRYSYFDPLNEHKLDEEKHEYSYQGEGLILAPTGDDYMEMIANRSLACVLDYLCEKLDLNLDD